MEDFAGNPVNNALLNQYDKQKHRGQQGFGVYDGKFDNMVHESKEDSILKWLVKYESPLLLMHHRFPTSTINVKRAAHPFSTKDYFNKGRGKKNKVEYILVHNGGIRNAEELYNKHFDMDIDYHSVLEDLTFNDSEALLWDFALTMEGKQKELTAKGGIAFIALRLAGGKLDKLYFARNYSSPLKMKRTNDGISLASELEDGEPIPVDVLHTWNYKLKRLTTKKFEVPSGYKVTSNYSNNSSNYCSNGTSGAYTPGSYASRRYSSYYDDCNCDEVGWKNCEYHGVYFDGDMTDWRDDLELDDGGKWNWKKNEGKMGERIGNVLAQQFGAKFGLGKDGKQGELIQRTPTVTEVLTHAEQQRISEDRLIQATDPITAEEITQEYMAYLAAVKGHFESAYWSMEGEYMLMEDAPKTKENIRATRLLEYVMERIHNDPDYENEKSYSNVWGVLWKKTAAR